MKPLDFGGGGINGSIDAYGRIIALNFYHPEYGYVTLTSADPFPEDQRYNSQAVRAYRKGMATLEGFGMTAKAAEQRANSWLEKDWIAKSGVTLATGSLTIRTFVANEYIAQFVHSDSVETVNFRGRMSLQRCAYTQLTEGGPVPIPPVITEVEFRDNILTLYNPALHCAVAIAGFQSSISIEPFAFQTEGAVDISIGIRANGWLVYASASDITQAREKAWAGLHEPERYWIDNGAKTGKFLYPYFDTIATRGLVYSYNMAVPVGEGSCLLTDHMLLPLSWNRDAYYLARALLSWHDDVKDVVRRHLIWMFQIAERTADGAWGRCYMANGKIKDGAFQLDQQLFPLLELAEYVLETGDQATFEQLKPYVAPIIEGLLARKASHAALFPTDETPADDPIAFPYHLSSHILFWVVLNKLKRLGMEWGTLQDDLKAAVDQYFVTENEGYAYATDGAGRHHLYHDANDFPTVLAPVWGFCSVDDPIWRKTIDFTFSERNTEGMYQGRLGSVHTRAPWALGDVQDLIVARLIHDSEREARAMQYLQLAAQPDGALPEAYDAETGEVVSRHWFAWPNAAYACVMLNAFKA